MRAPLALALALLVGCPSTDDDDSVANDDDATADDDDSVSDDDDSAAGDDDDSTASTWRSALYPTDWTPDHDVEGAFLHDFSYAGYHRSEVPPPDTTSWTRFDVTTEGADPTGTTDSTAAIQAAIDAASAAGGRVDLPAGTYKIDGTLLVSASNVVLAGVGPDTRLWFTRLEGMTNQGHLTLRGQRTYGPDLLLTADGADRAHDVLVDDASSLSVGDAVDLGWTITDEFVAQHGMESFWEVSNGQWRAFFRRQVTAVDTTTTPHVVTLDVPLRYPALVRDGASLRTVTGLLTDVGVQDLAVATAGDPADAWSIDRSHALLLDRVADAWVLGVESFASPEPLADSEHLASGGVKVLDSKRVTIGDCSFALPQNRGGGGNGYLYEVSRVSDVLIRDSLAWRGRHNFIQNWDFGTSGVVWLRTTSTGGEALTGRGGFGTVGASETHHSLAMANLVDDSSTDDAWKMVNRRTFSSGAGHTATAAAFWNVQGSGALTSFQYGLGYIIGTAPDIDVTTDLSQGGLFAEASGTEPEDWREGIGDGATLEPRSLFEDQLSRRLAD